LGFREPFGLGHGFSRASPKVLAQREPKSRIPALERPVEPTREWHQRLEEFRRRHTAEAAHISGSFLDWAPDD
jgi:hypothetical protein